MNPVRITFTVNVDGFNMILLGAIIKQSVPEQSNNWETEFQFEQEQQSTLLDIEDWESAEGVYAIQWSLDAIISVIYPLIYTNILL